MGIFRQLKRHFWANIHKALAFLCIAAFGTFITLSPVYAAVALPVALTYGLTIAIPAVFFLIASVCRMFANSKYINKKVAQKIVHRGKIFYNLGLSALGIGLFFIGVLYLFFPGLVAFVGLSSFAWIIGFTSSAVGIFFMYRSYKNLRIGSINDIKHYILEIMGYDDKSSGTENKILQIVRRNIKSIEGIAKKNINQDNENINVQKSKESLIAYNSQLLDIYRIISHIDSTMDTCRYILIFKIIYKSNPEVNKDGYKLELAKEDQAKEKNIVDIVNKYKKLICEEISQLPDTGKMKAVSEILEDMSSKIQDIDKGEKIKNQIDDVIGLTEKVINKTLSDFGISNNNIENETSPKVTHNLIAINSQINDNDNNRKKVEEYQYEKLLNAKKSPFLAVNQLNQARELNDIGIYQYFCNYRDELKSAISIYNEQKNKKSKNVQLLMLLDQDLNRRVPSAKNNKIWRNIFFLLLGIILTLEGTLSFIYPTLLAFIGLFGLLGELFAGTVIICGLSLVYESIKNFIIGTVVGFERSLYELLASNCNDSDKEKIYNYVVRRLIPLKTSKEDDDLEEKIKIDNRKEKNKGIFFDDNDSEDNELNKIFQQKNNNQNENKNKDLEDEDLEDEDENKDLEDEDENKSNNPFYRPGIRTLANNKNINEYVFDDQCFLISEQEKLLKLNVNNVAQTLGTGEGENDENNKSRLKERLTKKWNDLEKMRQDILTRTEGGADQFVHEANFVIKQNNTKLQPIVQTVLSNLEHQPQNSLNGRQGGVGGAKGFSTSLKEFSQQEKLERNPRI